MKDKDTKPLDSLTDEELFAMMQAKKQIQEQWPKKINVNNQTYSVKQISKAVRRRIHHLELEAYLLSGKQKEAQSLKEAKKISDKLDRLHAKTAAYYLLNNKAIFMPWRFSITWRRIMMQPEEVSAQINMQAINQVEINFSLANWQNTEQQLALSMKPIGDGVKMTLKRMESGLQQVEEDATKKKEEDNQSTASSKKPRKTKK